MDWLIRVLRAGWYAYAALVLLVGSLYGAELAIDWLSR